MEYKAFLAIATWIFAPLTLLEMVVNFGSWQSAVLFVLMCIFWIQKTYWSHRERAQRHEEKELELHEKRTKLGLPAKKNEREIIGIYTYA